MTHEIEILFESPIGNLELLIKFSTNPPDPSIGIMEPTIEEWWIESINGEKTDATDKDAFEKLHQLFVPKSAEDRLLELCWESLQG